jgi:hypothetical protein
MTNRRTYTLLAIALVIFWVSIPALIFWAIT